MSERDHQVVVEFWADAPGLPAELSDQLVTQAFALPPVRAHRSVLVCIPRYDGAVLAEARRHVEGGWTRMAGVTCMLEGRVRERPSAPPDSGSDGSPR